MVPTGALDPDIVAQCLDDAGTAMMALQVRGTRPAGYRSSMPEPLRDPLDWREALNSAGATELRRVDPPTSAEIAHMEQVYFGWLPLLGGPLWWQWERQRLVGLRSLCWPYSMREDPHVWSWRRLGLRFGVHKDTIQRRHEAAVGTLVRRLRPLPAPCAATLRRVREHQERLEAAREMKDLASVATHAGKSGMAPA